MSREKLIKALNDDLALELAAITQYMWHHVMAEGLESPEISEMFRKIAIDEMKHAEKLAERINYLGGTPVTKPGEIKVGGDLKKMIKDDIDGERMAIKLYKEHLKLAEEAGDPVTRRILEEIIMDEEGHDDKFSAILKIKTLAEEQ